MAQDWYKAFKVGVDNKTIGLLDANGVAIAGVKALDSRTEKMQSELKAKDAKIATQDAKILSLEQRLARLEALLAKKQ
jgi:hypothetical protein